MNSSVAKLVTLALIVVSFAACSRDAGLVRDKLDPVTSVTITYSQAPLVFYRDVPGRAAYARDYIHVAPIEVNRSGNYQYYLWFGIWNTMQDTGMPKAGFETIVLFADGEPLLLDNPGWTPAAIGASEPVMLKPVASATEVYFPVTVDQLRMLAEARDVRLQTTGPNNLPYEPWDRQKPGKDGLLEFLAASVY